jgi:hypothetical protein
MKIKFFVTAAVTCVLGFASAVNADTVAVGTSLGAWGTVFSDVEKEAYYHKSQVDNGLQGGVVTNEGRTVKSRSLKSSAIATVDTWDYRLTLMDRYLGNTLGKNALTTTGSTGVLNNLSYSLVTYSAGDADGKSHNIYSNIYGRKSEILKGNAATSGIAEQMFRNGTLTATNIISSSASPVDESVLHNWVYNASTDTFTSNSTIPSNGVGDHNTGIFAFVTSFSYDTNEVYGYLNGWFSELGEFLGVYVNGVKLGDDYLKLSSDYLASNHFASYDMEIDLDKLYADGLLSVGNNNIAFVTDSILPEYSGGTYYDGNDGLVAFASGLNKNSDSIFPANPTTPEPATLLILGAGLIGLGIRRKFSAKK